MLARVFVYLVIIGFLASTAQAADFENSRFRSQLYTQVTPYNPVVLTNNQSSDYELQTVPFGAGFLLNPLFNPLIKLDIPFSLWVGAEVNGVQFGELESLDVTGFESLYWKLFMPSVTAGMSFNVYGDFDLRMLGGYGFAYNVFTHEYLLRTSEHVETVKQMFGEVAVEYRVAEVFKNTDFKISMFYRQYAHDIKNIKATEDYDDEAQLNNTSIHNINLTSPKIGLELSLDFGRESRRDRKVRFQLRDRDSQLRENNVGMDTLKEWDCMAIERDYKFFIASEDGTLPDVRHKYTKSQYADVLESFLAFCHPEDLKTKELLYSALDSNKVQLKRYQLTQEEARYKQVMASNDVKYLSMFLQYYPESQFTHSVKAKIKILEDYQAFKAARQGNSFRDYLGYLSTYPEGHYAKEAETEIFRLVQDSNKLKDYQIYLKKFPNGLYSHEAKKAIHMLTKQNASQSIY